MEFPTCVALPLFLSHATQTPAPLLCHSRTRCSPASSQRAFQNSLVHRLCLWVGLAGPPSGTELAASILFTCAMKTPQSLLSHVLQHAALAPLWSLLPQCLPRVMPATVKSTCKAWLITPRHLGRTQEILLSLCNLGWHSLMHCLSRGFAHTGTRWQSQWPSYAEEKNQSSRLSGQLLVTWSEGKEVVTF